MDKIVPEQLWGELSREGQPTIKVNLDIKIKLVQPDESTVPVKRILQEVGLSTMSGMVVEDGNDYILRYIFDGKRIEEKRRVQGGSLYAR